MIPKSAHFRQNETCWECQEREVPSFNLSISVLRFSWKMFVIACGILARETKPCSPFTGLSAWFNAAAKVSGVCSGCAALGILGFRSGTATSCFECSPSVSAEMPWRSSALLFLVVDKALEGQLELLATNFALDNLDLGMYLITSPQFCLPTMGGDKVHCGSTKHVLN